ncbi:hypothetical protein THAOC_19458 [Thalassiosira oceanica]|uniref:Peptidase C19 ubiquitin carboxyl-terminal hydrolase domain-containing protein n=1 Tax=Thalassiosira oceanica TaxID=159749 RepID=K0S2G6_THAOC|nr:hypothetical protein THAOC_19458 [Thalassiosira oceanica]|eukprot:EJK60233.1 hypothetical protein THAOC_19458 [Thalassiosira oceanica]
MTLEECLSAFTDSELVDGGFEFEKGERMGANMIREKIKTNVVFLLEGLDKQYGSDKVYDLYAVSNHHGEADDRGHYTSYCKEEDGTAVEALQRETKGKGQEDIKGQSKSQFISGVLLGIPRTLWAAKERLLTHTNSSTESPEWGKEDPVLQSRAVTIKKFDS